MAAWLETPAGEARRRGPQARPAGEGRLLAQQIVSWSICGGRYRVQAVNAIGRHKRRIIEVEEIDTNERFYGSTRKLERLVLTLTQCYGELNRDRP